MATNLATTLYLYAIGGAGIVKGVPSEAAALGATLAVGSTASLYDVPSLDGLHATHYGRRLKRDGLKPVLASL